MLLIAFTETDFDAAVSQKAAKNEVTTQIITKNKQTKKIIK